MPSAIPRRELFPWERLHTWPHGVVDERDVHVPDSRVADWSTDPRSGTPGLPVLTGDLPQCLATWVDGHVVYGHDFVQASHG